MSIEVMRQLQLAAHRGNIQRIEIHVHDDVAGYLSNRKRIEVARLEESQQIQIYITGSRDVSPETMSFSCYDRNNNEIKLLQFDETPPPRRRP
jgi:Ribonuclease G/E